MHRLLRNVTNSCLPLVLIEPLVILALSLIQHPLSVFWFRHDVQR